MEHIGSIHNSSFLGMIIWSSDQGDHYRYFGKVKEAAFTASPVIVRERDKAQDRYYNVDINFTDGRPQISKMIRYYFLPQLLKQNHIDIKTVDWSRDTMRPINEVRPKPRKGPLKENQHHIIFFRYQDIFCPVLAKSVNRAWHQHYDYSPVPITLIGYMPYDVESYRSFVEFLTPAHSHGNWFRWTDEFAALIQALPLVTTLV